MNIRPATPADESMISNIHSTSWRNSYHNVLTKEYLIDTVAEERDVFWRDRFENPEDNQRIFIAEVDGKGVGFVCVYVGENRRWGSYLDNLHVVDGYQSLGVGKALLEQCAKVCYEHDATKGMCLLVNQKNTRGQAFYLRHGARNERADVWNAPDGSVVPTYWFVWDDLSHLV